MVQGVDKATFGASDDSASNSEPTLSPLPLPIKDYLIVSEGCSTAVFESFRGTRNEMRQRVAKLNEDRPKGKRLQGINAGSVLGLKAIAALRSGSVATATTTSTQATDVMTLHRKRIAGSSGDGSYLNLRCGRLNASDVPAIAAAWRDQKFSQLGLTENNLGPDGCESLVDEILLDDDTIKAIYLSRNAVGPRGGAALGRLLRASSCRVQRLGFNFNSLADEGARPIALALGGLNCRLTVLGLTGNGLSNSTAKLLAAALTPRQLQRSQNDCPTEVVKPSYSNGTDICMPTLERLFLGDNVIENDGAAALATMLHTNSTLKRLGLADNRIGRNGASLLAEALEANGDSSLEKVCVYGNPFLDGNFGAEYDPALHQRMKCIPVLNLAPHA